MSDLISRSKAIQMLIQETTDSKSNLIHINTVKRLLQDVDTAYDIDKVVEELNKAKVILANEDYCRSRYEKKDCEGMNCFECCAEYLIEIVKHGKVDNDVCGWKQGKGGTGLKRYKASCCDKSLDMPLKTAMDLKYCPYCGKKIKVVEQ